MRDPRRDAARMLCAAQVIGAVVAAWAFGIWSAVLYGIGCLVTAILVVVLIDLDSAS